MFKKANDKSMVKLATKKANRNFTKLSEKNWQGCRTLGEKFTKQFVLLLNTGLTKKQARELLTSLLGEAMNNL